METIIKNKSWIKILLVDICALIVIYLIPSIAHYSPFPLYYAEPMRLVAIVVFFLVKNPQNALIIAFSLPVFSMLFTGHPVPIKALLISVELFFNILLLRALMYKYKVHILLSLFISIITSKIIYYTLKYIFIFFLFMSGSLISIPIYIQLISSGVASVIFYLFISKKEQR